MRKETKSYKKKRLIDLGQLTGWRRTKQRYSLRLWYWYALKLSENK
jgi:hypothetical protein